MNKHHLDARGLLCPMPVIKTQNTINTLKAGDILIVTATDPGVLHDIPAWCRVNGHTILNTREEDNIIEVMIEVCD